MTAQIIHGDCIEAMQAMPDNSVDAIVTDPPYGLEFMGKDWDRPWAVTPSASVGFKGRENNLTLPSHRDSRNANCRACGGRQRGAKRCICPSPQWDRAPAADMRAFQDWCTPWATECLRVLKPGGHMLAFGGTRTWHRLTVAVEDAGFEIRDSIAWLYGTGFPKSMNVSKAIASGGGRPQDIRRMDMGDDYVPSGRGRVNYDHGGGSVMNGALTSVTPVSREAEQWQGWGTALKPAFEPIVVARKPLVGTVAANVLAHGTGALNIAATRTPMGEEYDPNRKQRQAASTAGMNGLGESGFSATHEQSTYNAKGRWPANVVLDEEQAEVLDEQSGNLHTQATNNSDRSQVKGVTDFGGIKRQRVHYGHEGSGGASRFFYCAKAPKSERPVIVAEDGARTAHATVKPLTLIRWLVRLVTPPGGTVLDPFAGSGTTIEASLREGFSVIGIEREAEYLPLIEQRVARAARRDIETEPSSAAKQNTGQSSLLDYIEDTA